MLITGLVILWIQAPDLYGMGDTAKTATATTRGAILTVAAAFIAASAAGVGLFITARTLSETQRANREADERGRLGLRETQRANREADRRDRYAKAIEQLGHDKAPVRLGAMYSLERLAHDNLEIRQAVVDVLCAYLRMPFKPPKRYELAGESRAEGTEDMSPTDAQELLVRQTAQRLLAAHLRPSGDTSEVVDAQGIEASPEVTFWPGISLDLTEAGLVDLDLQKTSVVQALFDGATFSGNARFDGATFSGNAGFDGATFSGNAGFDGATFSGNAGFVGATFSGYAGFRKAEFSGKAGFGGATFSGYAGFREARFSRDAQFGEATFSGGARFGGATFSQDPVLDRAKVLRVNDASLKELWKWPDGWTVDLDADDQTRGTLIRDPSSSRSRGTART
jgi:uncharacterized protein YjbI with pentapeptide repeats